MKKFLIAVLLCLCASVVRAAEPQVGIGQIDPNRGACHTGFERRAPGLCIVNGGSLSIIGAESTGNCIVSTWSALPLTSRAVHVVAQVVIDAQNAVGQRTATVAFYYPNDTTCSGPTVGFHTATTWEFVATPAFTDIGGSSSGLLLPMDSSRRVVTKLLEGTGKGAYWVYGFAYTD